MRAGVRTGRAVTGRVTPSEQCFRVCEPRCVTRGHAPTEPATRGEKDEYYGGREQRVQGSPGAFSRGRERLFREPVPGICRYALIRFG